MKMWKPMLAALLLVAAPGCSSDDGNTATQKCEDLVNQFCKSAIGCEVSGGLIEASDEASETASCKADASKQVECSKAQSVTSSYEACMTKLKNPPCDDVNQAIMDGTLGLPDECNGVILVP
ncbi:MAG TPA: hypothetical protein VER11_26040 [Polyangiaceae bacterium]|nr:hypothetical protein [Polyangiaceae bacterium]